MSSKRLLALASRGIVCAECSNDGRWSVEPMLTNQDVRCLDIDPLDRDTIYAGTQGQGVFRSTDGGRRWQPAGLRGVIVKSLAVSPHQRGVVYAGTKHPALIYRTDNSGASWEELTGFRHVRGRRLWWSPAEPPFRAYVLAIAISPGDPGVVLAGIELGAVLRSADGGNTWSNHRPGAGRDCHQLCFHARAPEWAYQAHGGGPAISHDSGVTWKSARAGLDRRYCFNIAADAERPDIWYAVVAPVLKAHSANSHAIIVRSTDNQPWQPLGNGLPGTFDQLPLLASGALAPGELYVASAHGAVWHSTDHGTHWQQLELDLGAVWFRLLVA